MEFSEAEVLAAVNGVLEQELTALDAVSHLRQAICYATFPGGKRIRPLFSLALFADFGFEPGELVPASASLELMHCASLIHDDLPALDNDDMRRGKPSCHKAFGEATAILAADFMIPYAVHRLLQLPIPFQQRVELAETLSATFLDLCNGQQLDLAGAAGREELLSIHRLKTGALFAAAARFAAIVAGFDTAAKTAASELGMATGVYFQIVDDYLDVFGGSEKGRAMGSDQRNKKLTFFNGDEQKSREALSIAENGIAASMMRLSTATAAQRGGRENDDFPAVTAIINSIGSKVRPAPAA